MKYFDSARSRYVKWTATDNPNFDYEAWLIKSRIMFWIKVGLLILFIALPMIIYLITHVEPEPVVLEKILVPEVKAQEIKLITGKASYYDYDLKDAPEYSKTHLTAATRDWPRGTLLKVCLVVPSGVWEKPCVEVITNDYGPNKEIHPDRIIDLSSAAFKKLSTLRAGIVNVSIEVLK